MNNSNSKHSASGAQSCGRPVVANSGGQPALALTMKGDLKGENGMLTMNEVIGPLNINSDLVALSACNTAGQPESAGHGEGFAGMTRAFM